MGSLFHSISINHSTALFLLYTYGEKKNKTKPFFTCFHPLKLTNPNLASPLTYSAFIEPCALALTFKTVNYKYTIIWTRKTGTSTVVQKQTAPKLQYV